jgi:hypothetical protein
MPAPAEHDLATSIAREEARLAELEEQVEKREPGLTEPETRIRGQVHRAAALDPRLMDERAVLESRSLTRTPLSVASNSQWETLTWGSRTMT